MPGELAPVTTGSPEARELQAKAELVMEPCDCPRHETPCHRKRRRQRRQCSACIEYCVGEEAPIG